MKQLLLLLLLILPLTTCFQPQQQATAGTIPIQAKLLVLGDSLTSGLYATHEQATFASVLAEKTNSQLARVHASRLPEAMTAWQAQKAWSPTIIVLEVGLNDVSKGTIPEADWAVQYKALLVDMKATGATVIACTMFWGGIKDTHPNYAKYLRFNAIIAAAATATGATVADLWTATSNCDACISQAEQISYFSPHYHGDNFHPSDAGHALIAETIFSVVAGAAHGPKSFLHFPIALDGT